jgi:hypothetical protein
MLENERGASGDGAPTRPRWQVGNDKSLSNKLPPTNQSIRAEIVGKDRASALDVEVRASAPVLSLCRELLAAGLDPYAAVEAYRAGTLALRMRSIGEGARLELNAKGAGFVVQAVRRASPVRQNGAPDTWGGDVSP